MKKEKMIEKITKVIINTNLECVISRKEKGNRVCNECEYKDGNYCFLEKKIASDVINAILPEGSVVLTKEELETTDKIPQKIKDFYKWFIEIEKEQARKETAKEIYFDYEKNIKAMYGAFDVVDAYSILEELKEICEKTAQILMTAWR